MVELNVPHLGAHGGQKLRRLEAETLQQIGGFIIQTAQTGGLVLIFAQSVVQRGIGHGGNHGVRVRVAVTEYINRIHQDASSFIIG